MFGKTKTDALPAPVLPPINGEIENRIQVGTSQAMSFAASRIDVVQSTVDEMQLRVEAVEGKDPLVGVEARIQLATQQAIAFAVQRTEGIVASNAKVLEHLPGLLNAAASVPALANLIKSYRDELDALRLDVAGMRADMSEVLSVRSISTDVENLRNAVDVRSKDATDLWGAVTRTNGEIGNIWKSAEQTTAEIGKIWQRVDFTRAEILFEMRYGAAGGAGSTPSVDPSFVQSRIINDSLITNAPPEGPKLNIGCGHIAQTGYVNVDSRELPGVDVVADISALPFEAHSVGEISSAHVLEHLPQEQLKRLLPYWRSLLTQGGTFRAIVPDGEAMLREIAADRYDFEDFRAVLFGGQEYEGDFHFNMFTPDSLAGLLSEAGFSNVVVLDKGRKNGNCFEFEIVAKA